MCSILDSIDNFWNDYKKHTGKLSIAVSALGFTGAVLLGHNLIAGSIIIGVTNISVFLSGLAFEKIANDNELLTKDNNSLKNEKEEMVRRYTLFQFPVDEKDKFNRKVSKMDDIRDYLDNNDNSTCPDNEIKSN